MQRPLCLFLSSSSPFGKGNIDEFKNQFIDIVIKLEEGVDFDIDGVVFEIVNPELKEFMGSNRKFHRWQIAYKENKEKAQVKVHFSHPPSRKDWKDNPCCRVGANSIKRRDYL